MYLFIPWILGLVLLPVGGLLLKLNLLRRENIRNDITEMEDQAKSPNPPADAQGFSIAGSKQELRKNSWKIVLAASLFMVGNDIIVTLIVRAVLK